MSGGHFDYIQYRITDAAEEIRSIIAENSYGYTVETLAKFKVAADTVDKASKMLQRVDWLVCSDDGEDNFHTRWEQELENDSTK